MATFKYFYWNGAVIERVVAQAAADAINGIMDKSVAYAKQHHMWVNRTGTLERSIRILKRSHLRGQTIQSGVWGSNVEYMIWQELGTRYIPARPCLRPAADAMYPSVFNELRSKLVIRASGQKFAFYGG